MVFSAARPTSRSKKSESEPTVGKPPAPGSTAISSPLAPAAADDVAGRGDDPDQPAEVTAEIHSVDAHESMRAKKIVSQQQAQVLRRPRQPATASHPSARPGKH